jgi:putative tricarboxylic transport membrane protein
MFDLFFLGFSQILQPYPLLLIFIGTFVGIILGCIPGFTITMGAALALPLTYGMHAIDGLCVMIGVLVGGLAGGQISGILLGIPGTPSSLATIFDGFPMAKNGKPGEALAIGAWASFFGGLFSAIALMFFTPPLATFALKFGPWEFFSLVLFGLTIIASLASESMLKGFITCQIGLSAACVGTDPMTGIPRFSFGIPELTGGFSFLPILIGLFAFSQLMKNLERGSAAPSALIEDANLHFSSKVVLKKIFSQPFNLIRSSFIGTFVGALPGAGASIACILSYDQAKKGSKHPEKFGTGVIEGVVASEAANNATGGGGLTPTMALGVPGDAVTAIMMGALILHGIQPGPLLITEFPDLVYGIFAAFFVAHFFMLGSMLYGIRVLVKFTKIPIYLLVPSVLVLCAVGSYSIHNRFFDIWALTIFGVVGYLMSKFKYPLAPAILGVILGPMAESNFTRAIMTDSDLTRFLTQPISAFFLVLSVISLVYPFYQNWRTAKNSH